MRKKNFLIALLLVASAPVVLLAQNISAYQENKMHVGVALSAGIPDGLGLNLGVKFIPQFTARAGVDFFPFGKVYSHDFKLKQIDYFLSYTKSLGYTPDIHADFKLTKMRGHLLFDYHPFKNRFRITAGFYLGALKPNAYLQMINPSTRRSILHDKSSLDLNNLPVISLRNENVSADQVSFRPDSEADVDLNLSMGRSLQPYVGIGYGYYVPTSRLSFFWDLGVIFAGKTHVSSPQVISGDPNAMFEYSKDIRDFIYYSQILPVINLGIAVRLF